MRITKTKGSRYERAAILYRRMKADRKGEPWPLDHETLRGFRALPMEQLQHLFRTGLFMVALDQAIHEGYQANSKKGLHSEPASPRI